MERGLGLGLGEGGAVFFLFTFTNSIVEAFLIDLLVFHVHTCEVVTSNSINTNHNIYSLGVFRPIIYDHQRDVNGHHLFPP